MSFAFPAVTIGDPAGCSGLVVFPLFAEAGGAATYVLGAEAIAAGSVLVEEVDERGRVPDLLVTNESDDPALFLEGEELAGAKQNRVLNSTVLVSAKSKMLLPVSCVEQGRWNYRSRTFGATGHASSPTLRHVVRSSVTRSLRASRTRESDQVGVWDEISRQQDSLGTRSTTRAMSDTFADYREHLNECRANLHYAEGARGFAVGVGGKITSVDVFDTPATCEKVWNRLLSGAILAALESEEGTAPAEPNDVEATLAAAAALDWEAFDAVGEGSEFRSGKEGGDQGAALLLDGVLIHGSLVARV